MPSKDSLVECQSIVLREIAAHTDLYKAGKKYSPHIIAAGVRLSDAADALFKVWRPAAAERYDVSFNQFQIAVREFNKESEMTNNNTTSNAVSAKSARKASKTQKETKMNAKNTAAASTKTTKPEVKKTAVKTEKKETTMPATTLVQELEMLAKKYGAENVAQMLLGGLRVKPEAPATEPVKVEKPAPKKAGRKPEPQPEPAKVEETEEKTERVIGMDSDGKLWGFGDFAKWLLYGKEGDNRPTIMNVRKLAWDESKAKRMIAARFIKIAKYVAVHFGEMYYDNTLVNEKTIVKLCFGQEVFLSEKTGTLVWRKGRGEYHELSIGYMQKTIKAFFIDFVPAILAALEEEAERA